MKSIDTSRQFARLEQQLTILGNANRELNNDLSVSVICRTLVEYGMELVDAGAGTVGVLKEGFVVFKKYNAAGVWHEIDYRFSRGEGVPGWVAERLTPYLSDDAANDPQVIREIQQQLGFTTLIDVPILDRNGILIGCLELHNKANRGRFNSQDIEMLQGLVSGAAVAFNNARMLQQQKVLQQALERSEERFIKSLRFANVGTWDWNIETGELYWSERIAPLFGYPVGKLETTYDNFLNAVHPDDRQRVADAVNACVEQGVDYEIEHRVVWPDGTVHWVLERGDVVRDENARPLYMLGVVQNITQRKELEEALRQEKDFAKGLIETAQTIVMVLDTEGRIVHWNPYMEEITGYRLEEVEGKDWFDTFLPQESHDAIRKLFKNAIGNIQTRGNINPIRVKSGELRYIEWYDKPLKDVADNVTGLLAIGQDITERRDAERALVEREEQFRNLVETTSDWIWEVTPDGIYSYSSPQVETILGYKPHEVVGQTVYALMPEDEARRVAATFQKMVVEELAFSGLENINLHKDGREVVLETSGTPYFDEQGILQGYRGIDRDITEKKMAEQKLQLAAMVINGTPEGVMITDSELDIISVNPAFSRTTGYSSEEVLGKRPTILSSGRHDSSFYLDMWRKLKEQGFWQGEIWNRRKDGDIYPEWLNISAIKDASGNVTNYAGVFSDISTQEHVRNRLHNLAYYDALTELPNRELFNDRLENALVQARRHGHAVGLIFIDLDRFKQINDTLGHKTGDSLLKAVAVQLQACVRDTDTVSRLGGDEFTVILPGIKEADDAATVAETIVRAFSKAVVLEDGRQLFTTPSIGISLYPNDGDGGEELLKNADTAMYRAKESGGGYQFYTTSMSASFAERLFLEGELRHALINNELSLAYQPQVDLATGRMIGVEALARWHHPKEGWISPGKFIPVAEETGLIQQVGEWVFRRACRQLASWQEHINMPWRMAVNVSPRQIHGKEGMASIKKLIEESGISGNMLELEFTESSFMENMDDVSQLIGVLGKEGIQVAIDDFGTGYSSLSYLKKFAIDKLKIDQSFVRDIVTDNSDAAIVRTIISMGHNLGLRVIAEGVETIEQLRFLAENGCDEVQGYYFSRPVMADEITEMLKSGTCFDVTGMSG